MALTEEQKERIKRNRARALEIQRRKKEERKKAVPKDNEQTNQESSIQNLGMDHHDHHRYTENDSISYNKPLEASIKSDTNKSFMKESEKIEEEEEIVLENFEIDASPYVTRQHAMDIYCLPQSTLNVCSFIEKENPMQRKWNKMKLYHRSEIRRHARERFGGLDNLVKERNRRTTKRDRKDLECGYEVFQKKQRR
jgi:DNA-repair protein complementing XP-A cells